MVAYTYSRVSALNFNTTPPTIARSATGSVYAIADTTFTTPLNVTMVIGGVVTADLSSDAIGFFPDFTVTDRTSVVWKQDGEDFTTVLTTTDPIAGPQGAVGPPGTLPALIQIAADPSTLFSGPITRDANDTPIGPSAIVWPDGVTGTYTGTASGAFPGSVSAYSVTRDGTPTVTFTQATVTRDSTTGAVTNRPAITVS